MHSKWQIWDFFSSFPRDHLATFEGVLFFNAFDPLCQRMVKDFLFRNIPDKTIHHKLASDIDRDWLEEEFQTLSLFGNADSFYIHQAQDLNADLLAHIQKLEITGRFLILSFDSENTGWKKATKDPATQTLVIEAPRFWETNKLLDFVCSYLKLPLSYEAKTWMLESLENDFSSLYNSAYLIKLNHPEAKEISIQDIRAILSVEKLDQFELASLYSRKKHRQFFEKLIPHLGDFEKMRSLCNFMQSHLIKMADTSYLSAKPRLTQYDKDIQSTSKLWKSEELVESAMFFNEWEILSKKKDGHLWHLLKLSSERTV